MSNYIGKIYTFENAAFPNMMLNLYGSASEGKNVVLWERDNSLEQQWKVSVENGFKLQTMRNTGFVLSRATDGTNNANVQADITVPCDHQQLAITPLSNGFVKISQNLFSNGTYVRELFLTAVSNDNGSSNKTGDTDEGNVYWAYGSNSATQRWKMTEVGTTSGGGDDEGGSTAGQKLVGPYPYAGVSADYNAEVVSSSCSCYPHSFHYGTDFKGREANGTTTATQIRASGNGVVTSIRTDNNESTPLGNTVLVRYDNVLNTSGVNIGSVYFRYCHLASINVVANQSVTASTIIGTRGTSGYGCAENQPHLHLEATTNSSATASNSPSEASNPNDAYKFDVRNVLYTKTSTSGIGKRVVVTDNYEPFNSNVYCSHGKAWYSLYDAPSYD